MAVSPTPRIGEPCVAVAFSGGPDSTALLMATARQPGVRVVALHVNHGLQAQADAWEAQARTVAGSLGTGFLSRKLKGKPKRGDSVEAWARAGRYAALVDLAHEAGASLVLLAQHADDQAETVLLQALRGAGPAGLAAMPRAWQADGLHWARPWLHQPRERLQALLGETPVVHDPSNADPRFARSRLRRDVMPALREAFPQTSAVLGEVARHAAQARALSDEIAALDLPACVDEKGRLAYDAWRQLSPARRRNLLHAWLAPQLPAGVPVSLLDRLCAEWTEKGARWPSPAGALVAQRRKLSLAAK
jgi:tRNA(Ile)-lysidine synthase